MKKFILYIVARYWLWKCPHAGKTLYKSKTTNSYYIKYKHYHGRKGHYFLKRFARISDHLPTSGGGKIKKHTKYKSIII